MSRFSRRITSKSVPSLIVYVCAPLLLLLSVGMSLYSNAEHAESAGGQVQTILNVSYDPTREFYQAYNISFVEYWKKRTGKDVIVRMSHGGAGKQARAVMEGLEADVVTLALEYDINAIAQKGLLNSKWRGRLPNNNAPYTSTIVFLVRKGNPKNIHDWDDLNRDDTAVITPNPKTSGGARWNYLAAWAFAKAKWKTDQHARDYLKMLFENVPVLDSGARGATNTFVERGIGDVLLAWENEALMSLSQSNDTNYEIVYPSMSIVAEPPVALIDANCRAHKTCDVAKAYLEYLYSEEAQHLVGKFHFRPFNQKAFDAYQTKFPKIKMTTVDEVAGGWNRAQKRHFQDNGEFDRIYLGAMQ